MLERLTVRGFKSLRDLTFEPGRRLTVLFGPNAAGKSNLLEASQALAATALTRTLQEALGSPLPIRGRSLESFSFPPEGIPGLLRNSGPDPAFLLEADLQTTAGSYRYRIAPTITPGSGHLRVADEHLLRTAGRGSPKPAIESVNGRLHVRRKGKPSHPKHEPLHLNHSILSDFSYSGTGYEWLDAVRAELGSWRIYMLDPRFQMRAEQAPADVTDIGIYGQDIGPYLYKLRAEYPKHYDSVARMVRQFVPNIEDMAVLLNEQRGTLDLTVRQSGVVYSSGIISEGTLRIVALCAAAVNPWIGGGLLAVEEPENGVHPRRLELIAQLLLNLTEHGEHQVIVSTHSPLLVGMILRAKRSEDDPDGIQVFQISYRDEQTVAVPFDIPSSLFEDAEISKALSDRGDQSVIEGVLMRGILSE